jgi:hypothetical protein
MAQPPQPHTFLCQACHQPLSLTGPLLHDGAGFVNTR